MPRVKRGTHRRASRKKTLNLASGYFLTKSKLHRSAQEAVEKAGRYAYVGRKRKKRDFRSLWIVRINAACRTAGVSYSRFMDGLKKAGIEPVSASVAMIPQNYVKLEGSAANTMIRLMEALEDQDDVQNVHSNFDIDQKTLEEVAG